jgi:hypothetical protein
MLMKTDELGIPRFSNKDLIDMIYTGHVDKCHVVLCDESDDVDLFNKAAKAQGLYLVDFMRENKIVWGVGRGSSVASYILYIIGVHKVNSIQYGLDFHEFMR